MTVVVFETCACGADVPRKIAAAETEPRVTAIQIVWCPSCGLEVMDCQAPECDRKATHRANTLHVCGYHSLLCDLAGMNVRPMGAAKKEAAE